MELAFERSEYLSRLTRVKESMAERGIEVLMVTTPGNMCYLTGYDAWSFYVNQAVVVAIDEEQPIWVGRGIDRNAARVTTFLDDANIHAYPDHFVQSEVSHPMDFVADLLAQRQWDKRVIGVEMDSYYFSARAYERLQANLGDATFADGFHLVNWVRAIKSPAEIAFMRTAARIAEQAMRTAYEVIEPGVRQCDAAAEIFAAQVRGTSELGGDYPAIVPMLPTGIGTSTPHITWTDDPFERGQATIIELAGCRRRYHCPMARTIHLGPAPQVMQDTANVVIEGLQAALDAVKPGVTAEQVETAWRDHIAKHGIVKDSRIGYSTGLSYPPDWGEHTLSLRPGDLTELQSDMTIHMIPGIWMADWGVEISECFRVTETGAEPLCDFPRPLEVKD